MSSVSIDMNATQPSPEQGRDAADVHGEFPSTWIQPPHASPDNTEAPQSTPVAEVPRRDEEPLLERIGRYRVVRLLGRGGMGNVYLGHDDQLDRQVAIKVPLASLLSTPERKADFLREARTLARLEHPGIVPVYDVGETTEGICFVVTRFVDGQTLKDRMQIGGMTHQEATELLAEVCDALHAAHKQGFVHRDIKPANLLLDRKGKPWVADFGLAVSESMQRELAGEVSGTPSYMAPEQVRGEVQHLDGRADIWSVGVVLYELLSGRRPFNGRNTQELFEEITRKEPRPLRMIDESIPPNLERIVLRALSKSVADRYSSAHDLAQDLRNWDRRPRQSVFTHRGRLCAACGLIGIVLLFPLAWRWIAPVRDHRSISDSDAGSVESNELEQQLAELTRLLNELRGLRRDAGDLVSGKSPPGLQGGDSPDVRIPQPLESGQQPAPPMTGAVAVSPSLHLPNPPEGDIEPRSAVDIPAPVAWPEEFAALEHEVRDARNAGDVSLERSLLMRATNDLIDAGHYAVAESLALRLMEISQDDPSMLPFAQGQLGLARYRLGKFTEALEHYQVALEDFEDLASRLRDYGDLEPLREYRSHLAKLVGLTWMRIGNVRKAQGNSAAAREAYQRSQEVLVEFNRREELLLLLMNFGSLESEAGNHQQALKLLSQGLSIAESLNNPIAQAEYHMSLGNAHSRSGNNSLALQEYEKSSQLVLPGSNQPLRPMLLSNWIPTLVEEREYERALELLTELNSIAAPHDEHAQRVLELLPSLSRMLKFS